MNQPPAQGLLIMGLFITFTALAVFITCQLKLWREKDEKYIRAGAIIATGLGISFISAAVSIN